MKLMDLIIQKSVELGVTNFWPIYTQRSQYKSVDNKLDPLDENSHTFNRTVWETRANENIKPTLTARVQ